MKKGGMCAKTTKMIWVSDSEAFDEVYGFYSERQKLRDNITPPYEPAKSSRADSKAGLRNRCSGHCSKTDRAKCRDTNVCKCCFEANTLFSLVTDLDSSSTMVWNREVHITLRQI